MWSGRWSITESGHESPIFNQDITTEDEEGMVFALQQRNRVRHIHFRVPIRNLQRFIIAIDEEYSVLESLVILPSTEDRDKSTNVTLPQTLRAPHLQRLHVNFEESYLQVVKSRGIDVSEEVD
jgi:hypothetical protein